MRNILSIYLAAGIVWGIILGFAAAFLAGGATAGLFWVFVFGDNVWPSWVRNLVYIIYGAVGLAVFIGCVSLSWIYARRAIHENFDRKKEVIKGAGLLLPGILIVFGYFVYDSHMTQLYSLHNKDRQDGYEKLIRQASPEILPKESDTEYYCRVIRKQSKFEIFYHGQLIKIVPEVLLSNGKLLFAVVGPYDSIKTLANEIVLRAEVSEVIASDFIALPERTRCGMKMFFIRSNSTYLPYSLENIEKLLCTIPSLGVSFPMKIRNDM